MSKKTGLVVGISVGVLLAAGLVASVLLGYVYVGIKQQSQSVVLRYPVVCDGTIIDRYNNIDFPITDQGRKDLNDISKVIDSNVYSKYDPSCQVIKFYTAVENNSDINTLQNSLDTLRVLNGQGLFANGELRSSSSATIMNSIVEQVRAVRQ